MNKAQLVDAVAMSADISKSVAGKAVDAVIDSFKKSLVEGTQVSISGLGNFETKTRKARIGRNPRTGEELTIPETKVVSFKPAKALKDAVNG